MGCIYQVTNRVNGKKYIGKTIHSIRDRKLHHHRNARNGSKIIFHRALRKYGFHNFEWKVLFDVENERLDTYEIICIKSYKTKKPNGYNMTDGGDGGATITGRKRSIETCDKIGSAQKGRNKGKSFEEIHGVEEAEEIKKKMSESTKGRIFSKEHRKKLSEADKKSWTEERRKAHSENMAKREISDDTRKKMSKSQKERICKPHSEETKRKMSESRKGKKHSEETKKKISIAFKGKTLEDLYGEEKAKEIKVKMKNRKIGFKGKKHTQETRAKMREPWLRRKEVYSNGS